MHVHVEYTGQLRTAAGQASCRVECDGPVTLSGLLERLAAGMPALVPCLLTATGAPQPSLLVVLNGAAVADSPEAVMLADGDHVSLMPPVAGG
jgi:molybdopterin converting factor small subunit